MDGVEWSAESLLSEQLDGHITIEVGSSFIDALSYDLLTGALTVHFVNGDDAHYFDRSFNFFWQFVNSPSKGWFYNLHLRGKR